MEAQEMIRRYKAIDQPTHQYGVKRASWMDKLGKVDLTLPIMFTLTLVGAIILLKKER